MRGVRFLGAFALLGLFLGLPPAPSAGGAAAVSPPAFADDAFRAAWERWDQPVLDGAASRSYTWGGQIGAPLREPFAEGPAGAHLVQYFDKSRMEINDPDGDRASLFYVTQGLLAREMLRGEVQEGASAFRPAPGGPAPIPFGDLDDTGAASPTYASFRAVLGAAPAPDGRALTARLDRAGNVADDPTLAAYGVASAGVIPGTPGATEGFAPHAIARPFLDYIRQVGPLREGAILATGPLYEPLQYVFGFPLTEAYWATVRAAGEPRDVLIQCFERRCLTYTPSHEPTLRVEMANTGLQYYTWRYRQADAGPGGSWAAVASPALVGGAALLPLSDGRALLIGTPAGVVGASSSQRYDPATGTWSPPVALPSWLGRAAAPLPDGSLLIVGGYPDGARADRYDPAADRWASAAPLGTARVGPTATALADGRVLVVGGGVTPAGVPIASAEIYDPATGRWSPAGALARPRYDHTATRLPDGRVLVVGGRGEGDETLSSAEIYDPATGRWSAAPSTRYPHLFHQSVALRDGRVLVVGIGLDSEIYDPAANSWRAAAPIITPPGTLIARFGFALAALPDGRVLLAGGRADSYLCGNHCTIPAVRDAQRYDPTTDQWGGDTPQVGEHEQLLAATLADGRVLVVAATPPRGRASLEEPIRVELYTPVSR